MNIKRNQGFSLIEIVLALGIISIGLVAILGLVATSINSSKDSKDDTNVALMAQAVSAQIRSIGYTAVTTGTSSFGISGASVPYNQNYQNTDNNPDFFFDASGNLIRDTNGATVITSSNIPSGTIPLYSCTVRIKDPNSANFIANSPIANRPTGLPRAPTGGLIFLQLDFAWPYGAPTANQQHKIVYTSLAKYDDF